MGRLRPYAPALLAAVIQIFLLSRLRLLGLCPPLVPAAVFLSGTEEGADRGAAAKMPAAVETPVPGMITAAPAVRAAMRGRSGKRD